MMNSKHSEAGRLRWVGGVIGALIILPILVIGVLIATFDANKYREDIARVLSEQIGRTVKLNGQMGASISSGGVVLTVADVVVGNPAWANRQDMAKIGSMEMHVMLAPLLKGEVQINKFVLAKTDIEFETSKAGKGNWEIDMKAVADSKAVKPAQQSAAASSAQSSPVKLAVAEVLVKESSFGFRNGKNGQLTSVTLNNLLINAAKDVTVDAKGKLATQEFAIHFKGGTLEQLTAGKEWPLALTATLASLGLEGTGKIDGSRKIITFEQITMNTPMGRLAGKLTINSTGPRPNITGALHSEKIVLPAGGSAAETAPNNTPQAAGASPPSSVQTKRLFSDQPFDVSVLRTADALLDLRIDQIVSGEMMLDQVATKLALDAGKLRLNPLSFVFAQNKFDANVTVDASIATPFISLALKSDHIDTNALLTKFGMNKVLLGKASFAMDVSGSGASPRAVASNLNGTASLEVGNGSVPPEGMRLFASNTLAKLLPGSEGLAQADLTCMSTKFAAKQGVMSTTGMLIESNLATVMGVGTINLGTESLNLMFKPQPKQKEAAQVASLPLKITGSLAQPNVSVEAVGAVKNIATNLLGLNIGNDGLQVPLVDTKVAGNPCTKALLNPVYAQPAQKSGLLTPQVDNAKKLLNDKVKGISDSLGKSLGIKLFGQ